MLRHALLAPLFDTSHSHLLCFLAPQVAAPPRALLESSLAALSPAAAIALSPFRLAQSNAPLLNVRDKEALLSYVAQHALSLHCLSKALEQLLLRFSRFQFYRCQFNSPPSVSWSIASAPSTKDDRIEDYTLPLH
jgi:hypothetical protein